MTDNERSQIPTSLTGNRLAAARKELRLAATSIGRMRSTTDIEEFDVLWKDFVNRTTRVWNKTEAALKGDPRFYNSDHVKRIKAAKKDDDLIRYLAHMRDVEEHSDVDTTTRLNPGFRNVSADGRVGARNIRITIGGATMDVPPPPGFRREIVGAELRANPVTSRGRTYEVPRVHLGKDIFAATLVDLAEMGLKFYTAFIDDLEAEGWDKA